MSCTMEDFLRDYHREQFMKLMPDQQREILRAMSPEERPVGISAEQIREYLERLTAKHQAEPRKPRRKK